mgnify:CR=1 FL=1
MNTTSVLASVDVTILESLLELLAGSDLGVSLLQRLWLNDVLKIDISDGVTSWHHVVVVDILDEWLDARTLKDLLLTHRLGHLEWSLVDTSDEGMAELVLLGGIVKSLDDDSLAAGITTGEDDNNLTWLDKLSHCVYMSDNRCELLC